MLFLLLLMVLLIALCANGAEVVEAPRITMAEDGCHVTVSAGQLVVDGKNVSIVKSVSLALTHNPEIIVQGEHIAELPLFDAGAAGWTKGIRLAGVITQETTARHALQVGSVRLTSADGATVYTRGTDYEIDEEWGTLGRVPQSRITEHQPLQVSYHYWQSRLDTIVVDRHGAVSLRRGAAHIAVPQPPALLTQERALANIWVPLGAQTLTSNNLFPIRESSYPELPHRISPEELLPKALRKLRQGEAIRILAWGDSVTDGGFLPDVAHERWQQQFITRLRQRFPQATIELLTVAWPGRNTDSFRNEPPGSPYNYAEKVLGCKPDLVISEFVNDAWMQPADVEARYLKFLTDFTQCGTEWIILTPHYVRPDWMGLERERDIDDDPRPYVAGLRQFADRHHVALADTSLRWGRLWRQGIPYTTLLLNAINHPDARGQRLFADSLLPFFPAQPPAI